MQEAEMKQNTHGGEMFKAEPGRIVREEGISEEEHDVNFAGAPAFNDPENPMSWPLWYKWVIVTLVSLINMIEYVDLFLKISLPSSDILVAIWPVSLIYMV